MTNFVPVCGAYFSRRSWVASTVGRRGWPSPALAAIVEDDIGRPALSLVSCVIPRTVRAAIFFCGYRYPVSGDDVPLDRREAEGPGDAEDDGAARSVGCAEVSDRCAEGVFEDGVAAGELLADAVGGLPS